LELFGQQAVHVIIIYMNEELLEQLETIEKDLKGVRRAVEKKHWQVFVTGLIYGGGFVLGTAFAIAIAGWILNLFGMVPGIGDISDTLYGVLENQTGQ